VGDQAAPYPAHAEWADPKVEHAARLMRHVFEDRVEASARGRRAATDIRRTHSPGKAGREMHDRLARLQTPAPTPEVDAVIDRLACRLEAGTQAQRSFPRRLLRDLVLRLMKPFTAFQREANEEALDALRHLAAQLEATRAEQLRAQTERLRDARNAARSRRRVLPAPERSPEPATSEEPWLAPDLEPTVHRMVGGTPEGAVSAAVGSANGGGAPVIP
jgi:hypothetical protein